MADWAVIHTTPSMEDWHVEWVTTEEVAKRLAKKIATEVSEASVFIVKELFEVRVETQVRIIPS